MITHESFDVKDWVWERVLRVATSDSKTHNSQIGKLPVEFQISDVYMYLSKYYYLCWSKSRNEHENTILLKVGGNSICLFAS